MLSTTSIHSTPPAPPILPENVDFAALAKEENPYAALDLTKPHKLNFLYEKKGKTANGKGYTKQCFEIADKNLRVNALYMDNSQIAQMNLKACHDYWWHFPRDPYHYADAFLHKSKCGQYINIQDMLQWHWQPENNGAFTKYLNHLKAIYPSFKFGEDPSHFNRSLLAQEHRKMDNLFNQLLTKESRKL